MLLHYLILLILQSIEGSNEGHESLSVILIVRKVYLLNIEGNRYIIKRILLKLLDSIVCDILEEFTFLSQLRVFLKVIYDLPCVAMSSYRIPKEIKPYALGNRLPPEVKLALTGISRLSPRMRPP